MTKARDFEAAPVRRPVRDSLVFLLVNLWCWLRYPQVLHSMAKRSLPHGRWPTPALPLSANDKFYWRKAFDRDPRFVTLSDKLACKDWVHRQGLEIRTARVLWTGTDAALIPDALLASRVLVKATHGSGTNILLHAPPADRARFNRQANRFLRRNTGARRAEWGYYDVPRKLFVEEMLADAGPVLEEIKFYTFGTRIERAVRIFDRFGDMGGQTLEPDEAGRLRLSEQPMVLRPEVIVTRPLPATWERCVTLARALGRDFDHMRVDLLTDGTDVWLGEMTVYNQGGFIAYTGHDPEVQISRAWDIRRSAFLRQPPTRGWRALYAAALRRALDARAAGADPLPPA